jgi:hypothetical protein
VEKPAEDSDLAFARMSRKKKSAEKQAAHNLPFHCFLAQKIYFFSVFRHQKAEKAQSWLPFQDPWRLKLPPTVPPAASFPPKELQAAVPRHE